MQKFLQRLSVLSLHREVLLEGQLTASCRSLFGTASANGSSLAATSGLRSSVGTTARHISYPADPARRAGEAISQPGSFGCRLHTTPHSASALASRKPTSRSSAVKVPFYTQSRRSSQQPRLQSTASGSPAATSSPAETTAAGGNQPPAPWTFTRLLRKRKILPKRMGHMLQVLEDEKVQAALAEKSIPEFKAGDILEVRLAVPENKRRVAVAKGICIARRNRGLRTTFTIRNFIGTAGGVERTFPLFSPHIESISVLASRKVRRAKLYYLRNRQPREYRVV